MPSGRTDNQSAKIRSNPSFWQGLVHILDSFVSSFTKNSATHIRSPSLIYVKPFYGCFNLFSRFDVKFYRFYHVFRKKYRVKLLFGENAVLEYEFVNASACSEGFFGYLG